MRVALIGYGRMGRAVERLALQEGHAVVAIFTRDRPLRAEAPPGSIDVGIDFSTGAAVPRTVREAARLGIPLVIGTTGWYDRLHEVREIVERAGIGLLYAPNFALGVNLFFRLVKRAAELFGALAGYDCCVQELHHAGKADSPSGTALHLAEIVRREWRGKTEIRRDVPAGRIEPHQIQIASVRCGHFPGEHALLIDGPEETIELRHRTRSRDVFARGALRAAEWIQGRRGLYRFEDMIDDWLGNGTEV